MNSFRIICLAILLTFTTFSPTSQAQLIKISEYHNSPPFINSEGGGLGYDIVALLNKYSPDTISFELESIERSVLNEQLRNNQPKAILLTNPLWFRKIRPDLINSVSLVWDADVFFTTNPLVATKLTQADDFKGLTMVGQNGYFYNGLNTLIHNKQLKRIDVNTFDEMLSLIKNNKADFGIINRSTVNYYNASHGDNNKLHMATKANDAYLFSIVLTPEFNTLLPTINESINAMQRSDDWKALGKKYNIDKLVDLIEFDLVELLDLPL